MMAPMAHPMNAVLEARACEEALARAGEVCEECGARGPQLVYQRPSSREPMMGGIRTAADFGAHCAACARGDTRLHEWLVAYRARISGPGTQT